MKVLVTGGSGFLGNHLVKHFNADDLSRRNGSDVLNLQDVRMAGDYDLVIHLAARLDKSASFAEDVFLTNVDGTINVLREMSEGAVFVFASTKDVYGRFADNHAVVPENCQTLYAGQSALEWSKLIAEKYVEYYAHQNLFRCCIFRMSTVYAPASAGNASCFVTHYADRIDKGEKIRLPGNGTPRRDILDVRDLAGACEAFVDSVIRYGTYNLGGGPENALSLRELVAELERVSGLQAVVDTDNPLPNPVPMDYVSDLSRIRQELGWEPGIDVETGLASLFR